MDLTPAARMLLHHMGTARSELDVDTAAQDTGLPPGLVGNALVALSDANLIVQFMRPSAEGPQPTGVYRLTARGRRAAQQLPDREPAEEP